jgi:hypothetical protein
VQIAAKLTKYGSIPLDVEPGRGKIPKAKIKFFGFTSVVRNTRRKLMG